MGTLPSSVQNQVKDSFHMRDLGKFSVEFIVHSIHVPGIITFRLKI